MTRKLVVSMPVRQPSPQVSRSKRRRRSDRRFFEALESCAGNPRLKPRPQYYYSSDSPSAVVVTFGHLYPDKASKAARQQLEVTVLMVIVEKYRLMLVAVDPQRLGTATAAYDLHFQKQFQQDKFSLHSKGELPFTFLGQQRFLRTSLKHPKSAPMFAQIVVKQLDLRWTVPGATSALLAAAGYGGVTVKTEFAGELPAHLKFWDGLDLGRSDTIVAQVAAPASDPSLRRLPRSITFQGHTLSISVSRSLHDKTEQRKTSQQDALLKQQRRRAKQQRRKDRKHNQALPERAKDVDVTLAADARELVAADVLPAANEVSTSGRADADPADVVASASKKRMLESGSDSEPPTTIDADALALVPLTPDDDHGVGVRRSSREHKKVKPYYERTSEAQPAPKAMKGLKAGFLK